jgi:hypothetical protein
MPRRTGSGNAPRHAESLKRNRFQRSGVPTTDVPPTTFTSKEGTSMSVTLILTGLSRTTTAGYKRSLGSAELVAWVSLGVTAAAEPPASASAANTSA